MTAEYRILTPDDLEQAAYVEAVAFYGKPTPDRAERLRKYFRPEWTVGAFVDGRLVADVRAIPMLRRMNGGRVSFAPVGPVACLAAYRRQGHVGKLLRLSLELMRERGQPLSGLYTPHDALYARYGWERAEGKMMFQFRPKDVHLRIRGRPGKITPAGMDDWQRLDAIYRERIQDENGPFERIEVWWREAVLTHWEDSGDRSASDAVVWTSGAGRDEGYMVYHEKATPGPRWPEHSIFVRDFVALTGDAYLGLIGHLLTHDLATRVLLPAPPYDPLPDVTEDPFRIDAKRAEGAMLRIVDIEQAFATRPYAGERSVGFTMRIEDRAAPWNEGVWRIEAAEGRMSAQRSSEEPEAELTVNTLAPLFTGHMRPEVAAGVGLLRVNAPDALGKMAEAFRVTSPPYCHDFY
jgi:predicted acetyltransferase